VLLVAASVVASPPPAVAAAAAAVVIAVACDFAVHVSLAAPMWILAAEQVFLLLSSQEQQSQEAGRLFGVHSKRRQVRDRMTRGHCKSMQARYLH
jgi:hypothetical protein